ncbi:hypothetical protein [Paenibacillus chitinolyticus]|uniref:hypothetical protein n=1 Tax=Paenibacillus chitinolyticus TaxID=79263 RepID=UPI003D08B1B2
MSKHRKGRRHEKKHAKVNVTKVKKSRTTVIVKQAAKARTGQGGNAFAINASDVGVVKTKVGRR